MSTHLIVVTETREFIYEIETPNGSDAVQTAKDTALYVHDEIDVWPETPGVKVSLHRVHPVKRTARWVSSRRGGL